MDTFEVTSLDRYRQSSPKDERAVLSKSYGGCSRVKDRSIKRCYMFLCTPGVTVVQTDVCLVVGRENYKTVAYPNV